MNTRLRIGVLLSGCGVYDGSEIHESVLILLALDKLGAEAVCMAPDVAQHEVVNHLTGEVMPEQRNVLVESARIARGNIHSLDQIEAKDLDGLVLPGGFGAAKNLTQWAVSGPEGAILPAVRALIQAMAQLGKPIAAVCIAPTVVAKALQGTGRRPKLTVGTTDAPSPYDIPAISAALDLAGAEVVMTAPTDVLEDDMNNIITSPCYMMESSISQVADGIEKTISKLLEMVTLVKEG